MTQKILYKLFVMFDSIICWIGQHLLLLSYEMRVVSYILWKFKKRNDDIFLASYPKAGNTILQMMLYQMTTDGSMDIEHISTKIPWFEDAAIFNSKTIEETISPRIFKTHLYYKYLPKNGKVIYVVRNVKDTCVSYFYHLVSERNFMNMNMKTFCKRFIRGTLIHGSWEKHLLSWLPHRYDKRVLFLQFNELKETPLNVIKKINKFCNFNLSELKMKQVAKRCNLKYMKQFNYLFDPRLSIYRRNDQKKYAAQFIRNGSMAQWNTDLSNEQNNDLNNIIDKLKNKIILNDNDNFLIK